MNTPVTWLVVVLLGVSAAPPPTRSFHNEKLGIAFSYPQTPGLRIETRQPMCEPSDAMWGGGVVDSVLLVTRTVAPVAQIASNIGLVKEGDGWVAQGYQGTKSPVAFVRAGSWEALVATDAVTVVYDLALRTPVSARQWRFLAMGPAVDGCRPMLLALATGMAGTWDSATVTRVLAGARPRAP